MPALEVHISRMAYLLDAHRVMILEMEALVQVRVVMELETEDPMDMEVQGMVEAEVMEVMEVTEAMEIRMAQDQIMTISVTRRDLGMEAIEALEDGRMQTHSSMETLGTIALHILMKISDLFIVIAMLAGHWK